MALSPSRSGKSSVVRRCVHFYRTTCPLGYLQNRDHVFRNYETDCQGHEAVLRVSGLRIWHIPRLRCRASSSFIASPRSHVINTIVTKDSRCDSGLRAAIRLTCASPSRRKARQTGLTSTLREIPLICWMSWRLVKVSPSMGLPSQQKLSIHYKPRFDS